MPPGRYLTPFPNAERLKESGKDFRPPIEISTEVFDEPIEIDDREAFTRELKRIAKLFGADLVGICEHDERWLYTSRVDTRDFSEADNALPDEITHVIVLGHSMDRDLVDTYPFCIGRGFDGP